MTIDQSKMIVNIGSKAYILPRFPWLRFIALVPFLVPIPALAQSSPNWPFAYAPPSQEWKGWEVVKQNHNLNQSCVFFPCTYSTASQINSVLTINPMGRSAFGTTSPPTWGLVGPRFAGIRSSGILGRSYSLNTISAISGDDPPSGGNAASIIAERAGRIITPFDFGAKGDGTTNDTRAVQRAIRAASAGGGSGTLYLGNYFYCIDAVTIAAPLRIVGNGTTLQSRPTSGFKSCAVNRNLITISADGVILDNFGFAAGHAGQNTRGAVITINGSHNMVRHLEITDPCIGIIENGNNNTYEYNQIVGWNYANDAGCGGVIIGTPAYQSTDAHFIGNTIALAGRNISGANAYTYGMKLLNSGGTFLAYNDVLYSRYGTLIEPGPGEKVQWLTADGTVFGDSTYGDALHIDTAATTAAVEGLSIVNGWSGNVGNWRGMNRWSPATGVYIGNASGGIVDGVRLIGYRAIGAYASSYAIQARVSDVLIGDSLGCGGGQQGVGRQYGILINGGSSIAIEGTRIAERCSAAAGPGLAGGIGIAGANITGPLQIIGNDLTGNASPVVMESPLSTTLQGVVIQNNAGVDDVMPTVSAAATIVAPVNPMFALSGIGTIINMIGGWPGRVVLITAASRLSLTTGGRIGTAFCDRVTMTVNQPYTAQFAAGCWRVH